MKRAEQIYAELSARGMDVILDDRNDRPGEIQGFRTRRLPIRIGIGEITRQGK
jgi:prolyl-tRNA synthetase